MSDIRLIELSKYIKPAIVENKSKGWVLNGVNNSFYDYIIERNNGSVTNSAINKSYIDLMYGRGLDSREASMYPSQWASIVSLLKPRELRKIIADFQLFGECAMQIIWDKAHKKITGVYHLPKNQVAPAIEDEEGEITSYFWSRNWKKANQNPPEEFPVLGTSKDEIEIYVCRPYAAGREYFAEPDYLAGLQYAELEEELSNFYINCVRNGLSAGYIINVPDGQSLTPEEKNELERKIKAKLTGSPNAQKFIINFGAKDAEITIVAFPVNERQHQQWQTLTEQARQQIMTAHRVVSPKLFGIMSDGGLGNNANELDEAERQMIKRVIAPKQQYIIDALEEIFAYNEINIPLRFKPLTKTEDPVKMSADKHPVDEFVSLGEDAPEDYEIIDEIEVDYEEEESLQLASTGTAVPNAKSEQDGSDFIVRYRYVGSQSPDRPFCQKMMQANKLYRKEDIIRMGDVAVNPGWGPNGANKYSIWLYKGGGNCYHKWNRVIFAKQGTKIDANSPLAKIISTSEARRKGLKVPTNESDVSIAPINMPNRGFLEN